MIFVKALVLLFVGFKSKFAAWSSLFFVLGFLFYQWFLGPYNLVQFLFSAEMSKYME